MAGSPRVDAVVYVTSLAHKPELWVEPGIAISANGVEASPEPRNMHYVKSEPQPGFFKCQALTAVKSEQVPVTIERELVEQLAKACTELDAAKLAVTEARERVASLTRDIRSTIAHSPILDMLAEHQCTHLRATPDAGGQPVMRKGVVVGHLHHLVNGRVVVRMTESGCLSKMFHIADVDTYVDGIE